MTINAVVKANPQRIARFLRELGEIGQMPRGGWSRLAFSPQERAAHELFGRWAKDMGLDLYTDPIGNTFAELAGQEAGPALLVGSHLDSVPQGGNFDGGAGVAVALEVARLLAETGKTKHPYRAVVFSAEEGPRFGAPCIGSRVATGAFTVDTLRELTDKDGRSVVECASELGLEPEAAAGAIWNSGSVAAFLELHIEQGRVLETRGLPIGIVDAIAGSTRLELTFHGRSDHSGATPMSLRSDALVAAGEFVVEVERQAATLRTTVATVGQLEVEPGSFTTVPGLTKVSLDVRDVDSECQRELTEDLLDRAVRIAGRRGLEASATLVSDQSPVVLHKPIRERLALAARERDINFCVLPSGASHDAAHVAKVAPTGMVFVPSWEGISHSPDEWSDVDHIARAAEMITLALWSIDEKGL
jgi:hydantoinase/carbamoylase family amidase